MYNYNHETFALFMTLRFILLGGVDDLERESQRAFCFISCLFFSLKQQLIKRDRAFKVSLNVYLNNFNFSLLRITKDRRLSAARKMF